MLERKNICGFGNKSRSSIVLSPYRMSRLEPREADHENVWFYVRTGNRYSGGVSRAGRAIRQDDGKLERAGTKDMTLYTFDKDSKGESSCYDTCAKNWPPFMAMKGAKASGAYTLVKRKDGSEQWAKDGMPLYYWVKDKKPGDVTGDGVNGVWHAAKP